MQFWRTFATLGGGGWGGGGFRLRIRSKASFLAYHYHLIRQFSMKIVQIDGGEAGEGAPSSPLTTVWNGTQTLQCCWQTSSTSHSLLTAQGPHSQIFMTGGSDRGSYFIPKKIPFSEFIYPKKSLVFLTYPKRKSLSSFFATQKNPSVFHRPKKITFGQNFRPKKITRTPLPPSLKYVSGTPGTNSHQLSSLDE